MNGSRKIVAILLALAFFLCLWARDENFDVLKKQIPLTREKSLVVLLKYGNGYFTLGKSSPANIFEGRFVYERQRPEVRYEIVGSEGRLDIYFSGKLKKDDQEEESRNISSLKKIYDNKLDLRLNPNLPLSLEMELGVIKGEMDLGGLQIESLNMEIGVSEADIYFDQPNPVEMRTCRIEGGVGKLNMENLGNANFEEFTFEGGVGSYVLDFTGEYHQDAFADIQLGIGKVTLYLPRYVGTRIKVEKSFLSSFSIDECYKKGKYYYNDNWKKTPYNLDMNISTGLGKIKVIWVEE